MPALAGTATDTTQRAAAGSGASPTPKPWSMWVCCTPDYSKLTSIMTGDGQRVTGGTQEAGAAPGAGHGYL